MDIIQMTALKLGEKIKNHELTALEAVEAYAASIEKNDSIYNCFITKNLDEARIKAVAIQKEIDEGKYADSPFAGVPVAIKDNICTKGLRTTAASKMLENFIPPYDAYVMEKVNRAGMIVLGKLNMDEFAMGSTTETSYFGAVKNPYDTTRVPGGSSGAAAAAVAANETPIALGSDTGGSIRQPSSFCGVTGIKPTYGRVSRFGLIAYASSLDAIGPIAKDAKDAEAMLELISGHDKNDSTSIEFEKPVRTDNKNKKKINELKIGVPSDYFSDGLDKEVSGKIREALDFFKANGAKVEEFELKAIKYAIPAYYVIACAEASSNLSRFDGVKYGYRTDNFANLDELYTKTRSEGFGEEVKRRLLIGAFCLSSGYYDAYYNKALKVKAIIRSSFDEAFSKYDLIIGPTAPSTAMKLGESLSDPLKMYLGDIYTVSANLAGLPAMSIPVGRAANGMPVGMQLMADCAHESEIFTAAQFYQSNT